jgi:hypothetical protein
MEPWKAMNAHNGDLKSQNGDLEAQNGALENL